MDQKKIDRVLKAMEVKKQGGHRQAENKSVRDDKISDVPMQISADIKTNISKPSSEGGQQDMPVS